MKKLFTIKQRLEIINRCKYSAENVNLDQCDLKRIINMFEHCNIKPAKIGNIIKYICVCVEENNKK